MVDEALSAGSHLGSARYISLMATEVVALVAVLGVLAAGMLYAFKGPLLSARWRTWITGAFFGAGVVFVVGIGTLGLPGAFFLDVLGQKLPPDRAWPLALAITQVGALIVVPASLTLRVIMPRLVGWSHAFATAFLTILATFLFTGFMVGRAPS
jgi:hypothetical protein